MPIVQIDLLEGRTVEQKRQLVAKVTEAITESLGVPAD
ncbi:MAG: 4-oxalocrotonate tautomerase, partial [Bacillota bacterium]|nr:4-oxalocrotonate tautomerase [Bacillota bacterium]